MKFTDPSLLPVATDSEAGATALYLQSFAKRADDVLTERYAALNDALNTPIFISTNAAADTSGAAVSILDNGSLINTATDIYRNNNGAAGIRRFYRAGLWHVGFTIAASAVGAVNNGSWRRGHLLLQANDPISGVSRVVEDVSFTNNELGNTSQGLSAEKTFYIPPDTPPGPDGSYGRFALYLNHGNTSSSMQVAIGGAKVWGFWISNDDLIRGV